MLRLSIVVRLLILGCALLPAAPLAASSPPEHAALIERIEQIAAETLAQPGAVGLSLAVARGESMILAKGYGRADIEHEVAMTRESMLRIGSVTKQYTAALILKLAQDSKLSLDDPLTNFVEFSTGENIVTIRHLLNHTSGIPSYTGIEEFWMKHAARNLSDEEMLDLLRDRPMDFAPGEKFLYNNSGYYILGMIIEKVTNQSYGDAIVMHLLEPLGLEETRFDIGADIVPHRARGYSIGPNGITNATPIGMRNTSAAGGVIATASDLIKWQQHLVTGRVVTEESFALMCTPTTTADGATEEYGFGLATNDRHDRPCISHAGGINGFSSMLMYFPDEELHIAVISNSEAIAAGHPAMRIAAAALGVKDDAIEDLPVPAPMMSRITGRYHIEQLDLEIRFWGVGEELLGRAAGQPQIKFMHQGDGVFRALFDRSLRIVFDLEVGPEGPIQSFVLEQRGARFQARRIETREP